MLSLILLPLMQERSLCEFLSLAWIWLLLHLTKELMSKWSPKTKIKRDFSYNLSSLQSFKQMVRRSVASVNALNVLNSTVNAWKMVKSSVGHTAVVLGARMFQVTQKEKKLYFCSDREINCSRPQLEQPVWVLVKKRTKMSVQMEWKMPHHYRFFKSQPKVAVAKSLGAKSDTVSAFKLVDYVLQSVNVLIVKTLKVIVLLTIISIRLLLFKILRTLSVNFRKSPVIVLILNPSGPTQIYRAYSKWMSRWTMGCSWQACQMVTN